MFELWDPHGFLSVIPLRERSLYVTVDGLTVRDIDKLYAGVEKPTSGAYNISEDDEEEPTIISCLCHIFSRWLWILVSHWVASLRIKIPGVLVQTVAVTENVFTVFREDAFVPSGGDHCYGGSHAMAIFSVRTLFNVLVRQPGVPPQRIIYRAFWSIDDISVHRKSERHATWSLVE